MDTASSSALHTSADRIKIENLLGSTDAVGKVPTLSTSFRNRLERCIKNKRMMRHLASSFFLKVIKKVDNDGKKSAHCMVQEFFAAITVNLAEKDQGLFWNSFKTIMTTKRFLPIATPNRQLSVEEAVIKENRILKTASRLVLQALWLI
jgi:hypothetical protein